VERITWPVRDRWLASDLMGVRLHILQRLVGCRGFLEAGESLRLAIRGGGCPQEITGVRAKKITGQVVIAKGWGCVKTLGSRDPNRLDIAQRIGGNFGLGRADVFNSLAKIPGNPKNSGAVGGENCRRK
jgi:hypothetical protein